MKQMGLGTGTAAQRLGLDNNAFQVVLGRGYTGNTGLVARIAAGPFAAALDVDADADAYKPLAFEKDASVPTQEEEIAAEVAEDTTPEPIAGTELEPKPEPEPDSEQVEEELSSMPEHGEEAIVLEGMSVTGILKAVTEKKISAAEALAQEGSRDKPRKTLISRLEEML